MAEQPLPPFRAETCHIIARDGEAAVLVVNGGTAADDAEFAARVAASLNFAAELATMTDTQCDFLDGSGVREWARMTLQGRHLVAPILYTIEDEERACQAIRARYDPENSFASRKGVSVKPRELVQLVAEALGLRRARA